MSKKYLFRATHRHSRDNSPSWATSLPLTSKNYTISVSSPQQAIRIADYLKWRKQTSMPIVKIVSYELQEIPSIETPQQNTFKVEIETIVKSINDLSNLHIGQGAYLIRQYLLGIQALSIKFNSDFDVCKGFFGVNNKGHPKVWISSNLIADNYHHSSMQMSFSNQSIDQIVKFLFSNVVLCVNHTQRIKLQQIGKMLCQVKSKSFSEIHSKFRKFCAQKKIEIASCLEEVKQQINRKEKKMSPKKHFSKKNILQTQSSKQKDIHISHNKIKPMEVRCNTIQKASFQSNSPFHTKNIATVLRQSPTWLPNSSNKQKMIWSYRPKEQLKYISSFNSIKNAKLIKSVKQWKDPEMARENKKPQNNAKKLFFKSGAKNKLSSPQINQSLPQSQEVSKIISPKTKILKKRSQEEIMIQEFNPLQQIYEPTVLNSNQNQHNLANQPQFDLSCVKTSESKQNQQSKKASFQNSLIMQTWNCQSKKSTATTTTIFSNSQRGKDSIQQFRQKLLTNNRLQEMVESMKKIANSILVPTPIANKKIATEDSRTYDFGGLIPIQDKFQSGSGSIQEINGKQVESLVASRDQTQRERLEKDLSEERNNIINFDLLCGIDIMAKFFTNDYPDLKESVWCGQQKKAEHLQIKLSKLGNFGRQISASFVPSE